MATKLTRLGSGLGLFAGALLLSAACSPPKPPTPPDFDPKIVFRDLAKGSSRPMVVDWAPEDRASLESRAGRGVILVKITDAGIEPLWDCSLPSGSKYEFTGVSPKRDHVDARTDAELAANFPMGFAKFRSVVQSGQAISADVRMIGVAELNRLSVKRSDLSPQCQAATHFVKELTIGGFQFGSAASSGASAGAGVGNLGAEAGYRGISNRLTEEGDFKVCEGADPDSRTAPARCKGILRVRLVPIDQDANTESAMSCGPGMRWNGSACAQVEATKQAPAAPKAYECAKGNARECVEQCEKGNPASCRLAGLAIAGTSAGTADNMKKLFGLACKGEDWEGCSTYADFLQSERNEVDAAKLHAAACLGGFSGACTNYGVTAYFGRGGVKQDRALSYKLWERACRLGDFFACSNAGVIVQKGDGGVRRDETMARRLFELSCQNKNPGACVNLAFMYELGLGGAGDKNESFKLYLDACEKNDALGCVLGGLLLEENFGKDRQRMQQALSLYEKACNFNDTSGGCDTTTELKSLYGRYYNDDQVARRACDGATNSELGCFNAAVVYANVPGFQDKSKVLPYAQRACKTAGAAKDFCAKIPK